MLKNNRREREKERESMLYSIVYNGFYSKGNARTV
jgi:hypothetical protein